MSSTDLLQQIDVIEKACHAALRAGEDAETIAVLVRTLSAVKFTVSEDHRPLVRGLANLASTHADILLHALKTGATGAVVHAGLTRVCSSLAELREALQDQPEANHRIAS